MNVAGSIESVNIDGRRFSVAADADAKLSTGGWENTVTPMPGGGVASVTQKWNNWSLSGVALAINIHRGDLDFLRDLSKPETAARRVGGVFAPMTVTLVDGTLLQGNGVITSKVEMSTMNATAELAFEGDGEMRRKGA